MASTELWGGIPIEVIGLSGEHGSGKTVFALSIDPKNTINFDFEKSSGTYGSLGVKNRIDVPNELAKKHPDGYSPLEAFEWWMGEIDKISTGDYSVIVADPISDIEQGMVDYVASQYAKYGFSSQDSFTAMGGVFWGKVLAFWKQLLVNLSTKCETFAYTVHMRDKWVGKKSTGLRQPKGKTTLRELSSLCLLLDRKPNKKGGVPAKPAAIVLKSRLLSMTDDGELVPILPPHLRIATPKSIREYIAKPPDYNKLRVGELLPEEVITEKEKMDHAERLASDRKDAAEAELTKVELMASHAKKSAAAKRKTAKQNATPDKAGEQAVEKEEETKDRADGAVLARAGYLRKILNAKDTLEISNESWSAALGKRGAAALEDMSDGDLKSFSVKLQGLVQAKALKEEIPKKK